MCADVILRPSPPLRVIPCRSDRPRQEIKCTHTVNKDSFDSETNPVGGGHVPSVAQTRCIKFWNKRGYGRTLSLHFTELTMLLQLKRHLERKYKVHDSKRFLMFFPKCYLLTHFVLFSHKYNGEKTKIWTINIKAMDVFLFPKVGRLSLWIGKRPITKTYINIYGNTKRDFYISGSHTDMMVQTTTRSYKNESAKVVVDSLWL